MSFFNTGHEAATGSANYEPINRAQHDDSKTTRTGLNVNVTVNVYRQMM